MALSERGQLAATRPYRAWGVAVRVGLAFVATSSATGCTEDDLGFGGPAATQVLVDPADFLRDVPCNSNQGSLQSYVVTLHSWDDEQDITPFTLGSSYPTPCSELLAYRSVIIPGKWYTAEIDGYEQPAAELTPFGDTSSGSRQMLDSLSGEPVAPRWTTICGNAATAGVRAWVYETVYIADCDPLEDASPSPTRIALTPEAALGAEPCAIAPSFDVQPEGSSLGPAQNLPCDGDGVLYEQGVVARDRYSFYVTVDEGAQGAECFARAEPGQTVTPLCNPITDVGAIALSVAELQDGDSPLCPDDHYYDVVLDDETLNLVPMPCAAEAHLGPLAPGEYALAVVVYDGQGQLFGDGASCSAVVRPGKTAQASCSP